MKDKTDQTGKFTSSLATSVRTSMLIQERLERMETKQIHFK